LATVIPAPAYRRRLNRGTPVEGHPWSHPSRRPGRSPRRHPGRSPRRHRRKFPSHHNPPPRNRSRRPSPWPTTTPDRLRRAQQQRRTGRDLRSVLSRASAFEVMLVHGCNAVPDDLDVLLRHRPRSIYRRSAAFHAKRRFSTKAAIPAAWRRRGATSQPCRCGVSRPRRGRARRTPRLLGRRGQGQGGRMSSK
jgi:hypothetical protein